MRIRNLISGVAVLGIVGYGAFSGFKQDGVVEYNDSVTDQIQANNMLFTDFTTMLGTWGSGETIDVDAMQASLETLKTEHALLMESIRGTDVPGGDTVKVFHDTILEYATADEAIVKAYDNVMAYVAKNNPANENDVAYVDELLLPLIEAEDAIFERMVAAQSVMASKYDLTLQ